MQYYKMPPRPQDNNYERNRPFVECLDSMRPSAGLEIPINAMDINNYDLREDQLDDLILALIPINNHLRVNYSLFPSDFRAAININLARGLGGTNSYRVFLSINSRGNDMQHALYHGLHGPCILPYLNERNEIIIIDTASNKLFDTSHLTVKSRS